jgi:alkanesulfonate monooxygenase SsuD/methylene tetrahydromethanopterin reductase-like flavin-dependent oxidoreductase (luciferase family)
MEFGVFDHLDRNELPLREYYEERLKVIERYERAGFYAYHLAEHHFTPLGMAPSPSVFLSAIAQRTSRLRFGPLVYALPLHHPLRVLEEICMLDQMSGGRLEIGFGRGSSPFEVAYYGEDPERAQQVYSERMAIILAGMATKTLTFDGRFNRFTGVPMEIDCLQKPHPPIWYGAHSPESAERAARRGLHVINNDEPSRTRACLHRYREVRREISGDGTIPRMGMVRFIVVAEDDDSALTSARRAYPKWLHSFNWLFRLNGRGPMLGERPADFDTVMAKGLGIAGSPQTVLSCLMAQVKDSGANYLLGQFAFGDLSLHEIDRSIRLFASDVMPALKAGTKAAA